MSNRTGIAYAAITACFFLAVAGCGSAEGARPQVIPEASSVSVPTSSDTIPGRWSRIDGYTQNLVCLQALERGGPDYRGMLRELMNAGVDQPDAVTMLPYVSNRCL